MESIILIGVCVIIMLLLIPVSEARYQKKLRRNRTNCPSPFREAELANDDKYLKDLQQRLADLETPFRFKIGDKAKYRDCYNGYFSGVVVAREKSYSGYYRYNTYHLYCGKTKTTKRVDELTLQMSNKK